jgi:cholesterol transport system auxiliary component
MNAAIAAARRGFGRMALALVVGSLTGCLGGNAKPDDFSTYGLDFKSTPGAGEPLPWQLTLDEPVAADPIAGVRIATRESDGSYAVLKGARWSQRAPELVQGALLRVFEDSGRVHGVGRADAGLRSDFYLLTELRGFEADYREGGAPVATIVLSAKLVRAGKREVLAARVFEQRQPASSGNARALADAFDQAAGRLLPELRDWVFESGAANWQAPATPN